MFLWTQHFPNRHKYTTYLSRRGGGTGRQPPSFSLVPAPPLINLISAGVESMATALPQAYRLVSTGVYSVLRSHA